MKKRGQFQGEFFRYALIIFIGVMIIVFGFKAITKVRSTSCTTSLVLFKDNLRKSIEGVHSDVGSVNEENFNVPCGADKVYFIDSDKDMSRLFNSLYEFPLIKDAIKDNVEKNTFLVKDNKVVDSFYIGNIELQKPYFVCSDTARGNLGLYLGGTGIATELVNKECAFDCTFEVVNIDEEIAKKLLEDAINNASKHNVSGFPTGKNFSELMNNFRETNKTVKIARRCNCGREPGTTVVEIMIKPEGTLEHFKLIEEIPKAFVDDLDMYLRDMSGDYDYFKIISDPLIMWHFDMISEETIVKYTVDKDILEYCVDAFKAVGVGVTLQSEKVSNEAELDKIVKSIPILTLSDVSIPKNSTDYFAFKEPVWQYLQVSDILPSEKKSYNYKISIGDNNWGSSASFSNIICKIREDDKHVVCNTTNDFLAEVSFYVGVLNSSNNIIAQDSFKVSPYNCGIHTEALSCGNDPNCVWCPKCDNGKFSGKQNDTCVNKGECSYTCNINYCGAQCDSSNNCSMNGCNGCYAGTRRFYDSATCKSECSCPDCDDSSVSYTEVINDNDGDGFDIDCDGDCNDNNKFVNLSSNNTYCDCNPSDGFTNGTEEKGNLCFDNVDNNCDGKVDNCVKWRCYQARQDTLHCHHDPTSVHCRGELGDPRWYCYDKTESDCYDEKRCKCRFDAWTECTTNPQCPLYTNKEGEATCCDTNDDCPGGICQNGICVILPCQLTSAYWDGTFIEIKDWFGYKMASVNEGNTVTLTVKGSNGCNDKTVNFEVWEYDLILGEDKHMLPDHSSTFNCDNSGCTATETWSAIWELDAPLGQYISPNPEYLFKAKVAGEDEIISKGNAGGNAEFLEVVPCTPNCTGKGCGDDGCGGSCGSCSTSQICQGGVCVNQVASLSASYSNLRENDGVRPTGCSSPNNWWYLDVKLNESGGVCGVTVNSREWYRDGTPTGIRTDISEKFGTDYIPPGGSISASDRWICLNPGYTYIIKEEYKGTSTTPCSGNVEADYTFTVTS